MAKERILQSSWIASYMDFTKTQESPELFHFWTSLAVLASAVRRNVFFDRGFYTLYPNLYMVLIEMSARCRKSTALGIGHSMLKALERDSIVRIMHGKATPEALIKAMQHIDTQRTPRVAGVGENREGDNVHVRQESTLTIHSDELASMIGSQAYSDDLITFMTDIYGSPDSWSYVTKTKGQVHLYNVCLSILGGSTHEWLAKGLKASDFGGGFTGRCIFVVQKAGKENAWPVKTQEMKNLELNLIEDLRHISEVKGAFKITKDAKELYVDWYKTRKRASQIDDKRMMGYYERKHDLVLKISMLLSLSKSDDLVVTKAILERSFEALEQVETLMPEAFSHVGTEEAVIGEQLITLLAQRGGNIRYKDALRIFKSQLKTGKQQFALVIETLIETGEIKHVTDTQNTHTYLRLTEEKIKALGLVSQIETPEELKDGEVQVRSVGNALESNVQ